MFDCSRIVFVCAVGVTLGLDLDRSSIHNMLWLKQGHADPQFINYNHIVGLIDHSLANGFDWILTRESYISKHAK